MSYLLLNFEKVAKKLLFLIVYTYVVSFAFCVVHDGIAVAFTYKNPVNLYTRTYQLVRWYYYNRDALSVGRIVKFVLVVLSTYWAQSYVCRVDWARARKKFLRAVVRLLLKIRITYNVPRFMENSYESYGAILDETEVDKKEDERELVDGIVAHVKEVISDVFKSEYGELGYNEIISKVKKIAIVKVDYELEVLIRRLVLEQITRLSQEKGKD